MANGSIEREREGKAQKYVRKDKGDTEQEGTTGHYSHADALCMTKLLHVFNYILNI